MKRLFSVKKIFSKIIIAAVTTVAAAFILTSCFFDDGKRTLVLFNNDTNKVIETYPIKKGDTFSVEFIHSVNATPVTDYYKFDDQNNIYVFKTVYYGFGAGVQTELNPGEKISYGDDGSMTIYDIDKKIDPLTYFVGTISDHLLRINDSDAISLRDLCGKNTSLQILIRR